MTRFIPFITQLAFVFFIITMSTVRLHAGFSKLVAVQTGSGVRFEFTLENDIRWPQDAALHTILIDADGSVDTGYRGEDRSLETGADYLIQGPMIHRFAGATQDEWSWTVPAMLEHKIDGRSGWVFVPRSLLRVQPLVELRYYAMFKPGAPDAVQFPAAPARSALVLRWKELAQAPVPSRVTWGSFPETPIANGRALVFDGVRADSRLAIAGLRNPERGFRLMEEIGSENAPHVPQQPRRLTDAEEQRYSHLTLRQAYCWLTAYSDRPIGETKLARLRADLLATRQAGRKLLLRFAYERSHASAPYGPTWERTSQHMAQLAPIIQEFEDVIYILQSGFIGAYGEWHNSAHGLHTQLDTKEAYGRKFFEIVPSRTLTTVRVPRYKREILGTAELSSYQPVGVRDAFRGSPRARIGFDNDGFGADFSDGFTWPEFPLYGSPGNPEYDLMTTESMFVPVDGELFAVDLGGLVNGPWAAVELWRHHYTSLGIWQGNADIERPGAVFSIDRWRSTEVREQDIRGLGLPVARNYFEKADGTVASRSLFDYLGDHIGYRIELQSAEYSQKAQPGGDIGLNLSLVNHGFAAPILPRTIYVVLIDDSGDVFPFATDWDWRRWLPHSPPTDVAGRVPVEHRVSWRLSLPDHIPPGQYKIGLWFPDPSTTLRHDPRFAARLANDGVEWQERDGINVLGDLSVVRPESPKKLAHWTLGNGATTGTPRVEVRPDGMRLAQGDGFDFSGRRPFTILAKLKANNAPPDGTLVGRFDRGVVGQFYLELRQGIPVFGREIHPHTIEGSQPITRAGEYEIVATYDGRRARLFVDGELVASNWMGPVAEVPGGLPLTLGVGMAGGKPVGVFNGELREIIIWDAALRPDEWAQK